MPTTRTPIKRKTRSGAITPQVIAAYQRALALHNDPKHLWLRPLENSKHLTLECSREYRDACSHLDALVGCDFLCGGVGIFDTLGDDTGDKYDRWGTEEDWKAAISLRLEIERACNDAKR